jgi:hypothetical protein
MFFKKPFVSSLRVFSSLELLKNLLTLAGAGAIVRA